MLFAGVLGTNGRYVVSIYGSVFSVTNGIYYALKKSVNAQGYEIVGIRYSDGIIRTRLVHRLMAEVFLPNESHKPVVNHLDGVKTNNELSNLE